MPLGLRPADAPLFQRLCQGDMKLLLRLGALLKVKLTWTEAALDNVIRDGRTALILDKALALSAADPSQFATLAATHQADGLTLEQDDDGWRVICLEDEVGNPLTAALLPAVVPEPEAKHGLEAVVEGLSPALRDPVESLLAARADDQRAAALERLRYAAPPLAVVGGLMPLLLADGAELVRERAIALLGASGAAVPVIDAVRALQRGDDATLRRLSPAIGRLAPVQHELVIAALVAAAARGTTGTGLVAVAEQIAGTLAHHGALDRLMDLVVPRPGSLIELVRALQGHDRRRIDTALGRNLTGDAEQDARVLVLLAAPGPIPADWPLDRPRLLERAVELLISADEAPRERMALAAAARRLEAAGPACLGALLGIHAERLGQAFDTSSWWLIAELCRDGRIDGPTAERLATGVRGVLREGQGPHLVALLEQQIPALLPCSTATRTALVEPVVATVARFHDDRSRDVVIACVTALGEAALDPLWGVLVDHAKEEVRLIAAELIPVLLREATADTIRPAIQRLLDGGSVATRERSLRLLGAAQLATCPQLSGESQAQELVLGATHGLGDHAVPALGHLAAAAACAVTVRRSVIDRLLRTIAEEVVDSSTASAADPATGDVTWQLDDALSRHTDAVPLALEALERICASTSLEPDQRKRICDRLGKQWQRVAAWQTVWGPGNIRALGETLARLAEQPTTANGLRAQIAEILLPGVAQLAIARALARVFVIAEGSYLAGLGGRGLARLVQLAAEDYFAEDEISDLVDVLTDYLAVPRLGKDEVTLRRRTINLIATHQRHASHRARARLRYLRPEMPADLQDRMAWA